MEQESVLSSDTPRWKRTVQLATAGVALLAIGTISYRLAVAPIHGTDDAASCAKEYAKARTRGDSVSVDFLSYRDAAGRMHRCGYARTATADFGRR